MIGSTLSHYEITAELGRGGMGIVYRATDTKLNREVALKILPAAALASEEDRARFFREAQAAAQLHHPNIATVFEIDEAILKDTDGNDVNATDGPRPYIAMEFISGETLQETIKKAPLKLSDVVNITSQVAEALKAAHAKEIVHRDIKSANVMITEEGIAKVLDFGLAKTNNSTMLTRMGSTLGTVAYMSPEQARGQEVDGRSDLYSLGTMMYEMIAGKVPFAGEYEQAVVYGILNESPEHLTAVRTGVPMQLEWIVNKLLAKEADYRYQSAAGLLADLKTVDLSGSGTTRRSMQTTTAQMSDFQEQDANHNPTPSRLWMWVGSVAIAGVFAFWGWMLGSPGETQDLPFRKFGVALPPASFYTFPTASPDGRYWALAFSHPTELSEIRLWDLETNTIQSIPGSGGYFRPKFSPDGSWIAFSNNWHTARARVPLGSALPVDSSAEFIWIDTEHLLVGRRDSLSATIISLQDGSRTSIEFDEVDSTYTGFWDYAGVPHSDTFLLTGAKADESRDVLVADISDGTVKVLIQGACCALPQIHDYLLYMTGEELVRDNPHGKLVAQRFDPDELALKGAPADILPDQVIQFQMGVGLNDMFFQLPKRVIFIDESSLSWLYPESGLTESLGFPLAKYDRISLSPDGSQVAVEKMGNASGGEGKNIYILDIETRAERRLTYETSENRAPSGGNPGKSIIRVAHIAKLTSIPKMPMDPEAASCS